MHYLNKKEWLPLLPVVVIWILSFYFYTHFPARVATHWDSLGNVNGYMSTFWGAFFLPFIATGLYLLFFAIPYLDPRRERYEQFSSVYLLFKTLILGMLGIIYFLGGLTNLGYSVHIAVIVPILVGILFIILGNYITKVKSNWFIGVRTPWTLSSENVWNKTQRFSGKIMVLFGLALLLSPLFSPKFTLGIIIIGAIAIGVGSFVYSFLEYKKEQSAIIH